MKKYTLQIITLFLIAMTLIACSRKKDKFLNKKFHAVTTKYNVLYNGNIAFEEGKDYLINSFNDNYWQILPVERMETSEEIFLPGSSKNENFKRAEEKAVKAIQKHGMNIGGKEKNPETDEAYLLLGKSRYFDQRFIPALEAFNYILYKHPTSDKINHAKVWREKVNIRLENEEVAIENLKRLIEQEELSKQDISDSNAMLAQAYLNLKHLDSALTHIKIAVENTKNKEVRGRLGIIKGQIYNRLGYKDSANTAFDEIIEMKRKTLWVYYVNAQVLKARNFDFEKGNKAHYSEYLTKLSENREHRSFLDKIYNLQAVYNQEQEHDSLAKVFYNKSLKNNNNDKYLESVNYRALAAYRFDATDYKSAGAYYDSTLLKLRVNNKEYRFFKKKRENLDDVILYEDIAKRNDSILKILNYTDDERVVYMEKHIAALQAKEELDRSEKAKKVISGSNNGLLSVVKGKNNKGSAFYFYNPTTIAYGKTEFRKTWGERTLEDNWRRNDKNIMNQFQEEETDSIKNAVVDLDEKYTVEYYLKKLPNSPKQKDSIIKKRNFAYYQLGLIYKQKFKEYPLAAKRLEQLLSFNPNERLELPVKYHLYKIYDELGWSKKEMVKQEIISEYPNSRYAEILQNPSASLSFSEASPEAIYNKLYKEFEAENYKTVLIDLEKYIIQFDGDELIGKYELLKATIIGKTQGVKAYKEAINYVALNYPNREEGKSAQGILNTAIPALEKQKFVNKELSENHKLIYIFDNDKESAFALTKYIGDVLKKTYREHLKVSSDYYNEMQNFVVVHGFITPETAKNFQLYLDENKDKYQPISKAVIASSVNYEVIQIHKNLNEYINPQK